MYSIKRRSRIVAIALLAVILIYSFYSYYSLAYKLQKLEVERHGKGYVSDEVWYVSSARNILQKVFNRRPTLSKGCGASIIFKGQIYIGLVRSIAEKYSVNLTDTVYHDIKAIYVESSNCSNIQRFYNELKRSKGINTSGIVYGWRIPDAANIHEYLNLEHPPMAKYLIALSITAFHDEPLYWRIPEIVAGVLLVLAVYILGYVVTKNEWLSLIAALLTSLDPITRALSSIALLDIYVALFTTLSMIPLAKRKYMLSIVLAGIGSAFKFSVLFALIPVYILYIREALKKRSSPVALIDYSFIFLFLSVAVFLLVQIIVSLPLISYLGFKSWIDQSIIGAIMWHASVKCTSPGCPPVASPIDWFIGRNAFPLYYFPNNTSLMAEGFWPLWLLTLTATIVFLPGYVFEKRFGLQSLFLYGTWSGYILLWIIGGRTQYSFYSVQFVGLVYLELIIALAFMFILRGNGLRALNLWRRLFIYLWHVFLKLVLVED